MPQITTLSQAKFALKHQFDLFVLLCFVVIFVFSWDSVFSWDAFCWRILEQFHLYRGKINQPPNFQNAVLKKDW